MDTNKSLNTSMKAIRRCSDEIVFREGEDFISSLSDDLLLVILSFLDTKVSFHTRLLSRRWRRLWSSLHVLNVDQRLYSCLNKYPFTNSLENVITVYLSVLWNVQEIYLKLSSEPPRCLFTWKSIRVLKLKGVNGFLWIRNSHSVDLPLLKALHLTRLVLDMNLVNDFISKCPVLQVLSIKCCEFLKEEGLNISSPQLDKLELISYHKNYGTSKHYEINILAPKLACLRCRDYIRKTYFLGTLPALVDADIDIKRNEHFGPFVSKEEYTKRVIKFLESLSHTESLTLSDSSVKTFSSALEESQGLSTQFPNLQHLKLTARPNHACGHIVQLLKISPNMKTLLLVITWANFESYKGRLYWDEPSFYSKIIKDNWEEDPQFQFMLYHFKSFEIRNFLGCDNEIKFLKFLLMKATVLEKINIVLAQVWPHSRTKMIWEVWNMLQRVPRASPTVSLEFVNYCVLKL